MIYFMHQLVRKTDYTLDHERYRFGFAKKYGRTLFSIRIENPDYRIFNIDKPESI